MLKYLLHTISSLLVGVILVTSVFEFTYISCNWRGPIVHYKCNEISYS